MKLYHGTMFDQRILDEGIKPRRLTKKNNWKNSVSSHPDAVYLTAAYAPYFAVNACKKPKDIAAVFEIDLELLDYSNLAPDEDSLEQSGRRCGDNLPEEWKMPKRTEYYRKNLREFSHHWLKSVECLGNCCHFGTIPSSAITRVATFDPSENAAFPLIMLFTDPIISLTNYYFCGKKYRYYTSLLFGDTPSKEDCPAERNLQLIDGEPNDISPQMMEAFRWEFPPKLPCDRKLINIITL